MEPNYTILGYRVKRHVDRHAANGYGFGMDETLKTLLAKHKDSQTDASAAVGVPLQTLNNWTIRGISREGKLLTWLALNAPKTLKRWLQHDRP